MDKSLIVFYSWSGNTKKIAQAIQGTAGGQLLEIRPVTPYPRNYGACTDQAKKEIREGFLPEIEAYADDPDGFDNVFFGTPIWWGTIAPPLNTFLSQVDLSGKRVIPFCTHGGGGAGRFVSDLGKLCPGSEIAGELVLYDDGGRSLDHEVQAWIESL